jgi:hypothetical protein
MNSVNSLMSTTLISVVSDIYCAGKDDIKHLGETFRVIDATDTESVIAAMATEPDLIPYECCRSSGILSFWDEPDEDLYTFEDGQPL